MGDKRWGLHTFRQHRPQEKTVHRSVGICDPGLSRGDMWKDPSQNVDGRKPISGEILDEVWLPLFLTCPKFLPGKHFSFFLVELLRHIVLASRKGKR